MSEELASRWLVSTDWLAQHLDDQNVVILDGSYYLANAKRDAEAEFLSRHIPGAQRFDIDAISDKSNPLPHMLPSPEQFAAQVGALGAGDGMTIVLYDGNGLYGAARVWWTFRAFGADKVRVLDGGRLAVMHKGTVEFSDPAVGFRDAGVIGRDLVVCRNCLTDEIDRRFRLALLQRDHAEVMEAIELPRIGRKDAAVQFLGLAQLAGLMAAERKLEQSVDPRRFAGRHPFTTGVSGRAPHSDHEPS